MSSSWQDTYRPNAAIGADQRPAVAVLLQTSDDEEIRKLGERLENPGPPLVSTADIDELFKLMEAINELTFGDVLDGDVLDHPWGYVRLLEHGRGFRLTAPGAKESQSGWGSSWPDNVFSLARKMYEDHLRSRGLVPQIPTL